RMMAAKDYLHSTGKLQNDDVENELDDKIWNRSNLISDYSRETYLKLSDLLRKARDNEQERVKKKAEEMERKKGQKKKEGEGINFGKGKVRKKRNNEILPSLNSKEKTSEL